MIPAIGNLVITKLTIFFFIPKKIYKAMGEPDYLVYYLDEENKRLVVKPLGEGRPEGAYGVYKVYKHREGRPPAIKVTFPKEIYRSWGEPKQILMRYFEERKELIVEPVSKLEEL